VANKNYPFPWLICKWLTGSNPDKEDMIDEYRAATDLASFVQAMKQIPALGGPKCRRGQPLSTRDKEVQQSIPLLNELYDTNLLKELWVIASKAPHWEKDPIWIHGDLHAGNLLAKDRKLVGVVDWGLAGVGDPAYDMMVAWTLLSQQSREIFRSMVQPDDHTWTRSHGWALFLGIVVRAHSNSHTPRLFNRQPSDEQTLVGRGQGHCPPRVCRQLTTAENDCERVVADHAHHHF